MKKNVNKNPTDILDLLLLAIILLTSNFFDLLQLPDSILSVNSYTSKQLILVLCLLSFLLKTVFVKYDTSQKFYFGVSFFWLLFSVAFLIVVSSISYGQSLLISVGQGYFYFIPILLYYTYRHKFLSYTYIINIFNIVSWVGFLYSLIYIFQYLLMGKFQLVHPSAAIDIINISKSSNRLQAPADLIYLGFVGQIVLQMLNKSKISRNIFFYLAFLVYFFFVGQVRMYLLAVITVLIILLIRKNILMVKRFRITMLSLLTTIGVATIMFVTRYLNFSAGNRVNSLSVRNEEINYYLSHIFDNVTFGIGFPSPDLYYSLLHGFSQRFGNAVYYVDDIGIVGFVGIFGVVGIIYIILLLANLVRSIIKSNMKSQMIIIITAFLFTFPTLIMLNVQRILGFALVIMVLEYFAHEKGDIDDCRR